MQKIMYCRCCSCNSLSGLRTDKSETVMSHVGLLHLQSDFDVELLTTFKGHYKIFPFSNYLIFSLFFGRPLSSKLKGQTFVMVVICLYICLSGCNGSAVANG